MDNISVMAKETRRLIRQKHCEIAENNVNIANSVLVNLQHQHGEYLSNEVRSELREVLTLMNRLGRTMVKERQKFEE